MRRCWIPARRPSALARCPEPLCADRLVLRCRDRVVVVHCEDTGYVVELWGVLDAGAERAREYRD